MIDPKFLRTNLDKVTDNLSRRGFKLDIGKVSAGEDARKELQIKTQELQHERNLLSKEIGKLKSKGEDAATHMEEVSTINIRLKDMEKELDSLTEELDNYYLTIPNLLEDGVPIGTSEDDNKLVRQVGVIPNFTFTPKEHSEIEVCHDSLDFASAAKLTGSRFVVLKNNIANLHRALTQFMLDLHTREHGYEEVYVPYLVNKKTMQNSGQLPKFAADLFSTQDSGHYMIPTGEVPIANLVADSILDVKDMPIKLVGTTPCFRKEAGSYGKDTTGMIRQHQFEKVELITVCLAKDSSKMLDQITSHAEAVLQKLNLPYRVMELCSGDIGFAAAKTYDLEVWLPGQGKFREISSCSNCHDFQARRMKSRIKTSSGMQLVHTLNGSGLAVGRTLIAVLENYQQEDGSVMIPEVLRPYMNGLKVIKIQ